MQHQGEGAQQQRFATTEHTTVAALEARRAEGMAQRHAEVTHFARAARFTPQQVARAVGFEDIAHRQDSRLEKSGLCTGK